MNVDNRIWQQIRLGLISTTSIVLGTVVLYLGQRFLTLTDNQNANTFSMLILITWYLSTLVAGYSASKDSINILSGRPLDKHFNISRILWLVPLGFVLQFIGSYISSRLDPFGQELSLQDISFYIKLFVIGFVFPIGEELLFRKMYWKHLKNKSGKLLWLFERSEINISILVAVVFAFVHAPSYGLASAIGLLPLSFTLSLLRLHYKNITESTILHIVFNCCALLVV